MSCLRAFTLLLVCLCAGCVNHPTPRPGQDPPAAASPAEAFRKFSDALRTDDLEAVYALLSRDTQRRYELWEFKYMFDKTRFGRLFRYLMLEWKVQGYEVQADQRTAIVTLVHPREAQFRKRFQMVLEGVQWRVRLTLAQALDMPEFDERVLFPEAFGGGR